MVAIVLLGPGCGGGSSAPANAGPVATQPVTTPLAPTPVVPPTTSTPPAVPAPANTVVVSGTATYEFVPARDSGALNYAAIVNKPARGATIQALAGSAVLASAVVSEQGNFSLTLPVNTTYFLRLRAELVSTMGPATWTASVKDNTSGNALWVVDGLAVSSGTANATRSISAGSGWDGSRYTSGGRAAGPFAILDMVFTSFKFIAQTQPTVNFPPLDVFWSPNNTTAGSSSNDPATGELGGTFFLEKTINSVLTRSIYVLGQENDDTDEYDVALVGHEIGHYVQSAFSSDHSLGGSHSRVNKLDMTLAFSEGWGTAWSSMMRGNPIYADSFGLGQSRGFMFSVLTVPSDSDRGWYREDSIFSALYALFASHGFAPIWQTLTGPMLKTQDALATVFSFADGIRSLGSAGNSAVISTLNSVLAAQNVFTGAGADQWGSGETNNGGSVANLPIYSALAFNTATPVCFTNDNQVGTARNKLGMVKYFRIKLSPAQAGFRTVIANFQTGRDLDFEVLQNRVLVLSAGRDSAGEMSESASGTLSAGEVVIRVSDFITTTPPVSPNCATLTIR